MNAPGFCRLYGTGRAVDVTLYGPGKRTNGAVLDRPGNGLHRLEITRTGHGKAGLDDIHSHFFEDFGDPYLFIASHRRSGALLTIAQRGIENYQLIVHICNLVNSRTGTPLYQRVEVELSNLKGGVFAPNGAAGPGTEQQQIPDGNPEQAR